MYAALQVAQRRGVPCHVDACLGGFVLPFARKLGHRVPPFDFAVPGVTSMSVDSHKFGMAHKVRAPGDGLIDYTATSPGLWLSALTDNSYYRGRELEQILVEACTVLYRGRGAN